MRVISGTAKGRKLKTLPGENITRPTTELVKEAVFSMLRFDIEDRKVLDLFSGSGQMAIEAVSNGAACAYACDSSAKAISIIKDNVSALGFSDQIKVLQTDAFSYLSLCSEKFDIAFLDPPYRQNFLDKALPLLCDKINAGGIVVCESSCEEELPENVGALKLYRTYRYSKTKITVYHCEV